MKIKTRELIGLPLDYAVAIAKGGTGFWYDTVATYWVKINGHDRALSKGWASKSFTPSTDWAHGGEIIEEADISVIRCNAGFKLWNNDLTLLDAWAAMSGEQSYETSTDHQSHEAMLQFDVDSLIFGHTPLVAAMRCYVFERLGAVVDIPEGLLT